MLSGIYTPDSGSIFIHGEQVNIHSPKHAIELGIGMIHQHFKLIDVLTAAENVLLGHSQSVFISNKSRIKSIQNVMEKYGMKLILTKG